MDKQGFKKFLKFYNKWVYSILSNPANDNEIVDDLITDEELEFLYKVYQEVEFNLSNPNI